MQNKDSCWYWGFLNSKLTRVKRSNNKMVKVTIRANFWELLAGRHPQVCHLKKLFHLEDILLYNIKNRIIVLSFGFKPIPNHHFKPEKTGLKA